VKNIGAIAWLFAIVWAFPAVAQQSDMSLRTVDCSAFRKLPNGDLSTTKDITVTDNSNNTVSLSTGSVVTDKTGYVINGVGTKQRILEKCPNIP
jgi:hypothetical protein